MRTAIKSARTAISSKSSELEKDVKAAISNINRAATKGVIAKETAQRYISRIMRSAAAPR